MDIDSLFSFVDECRIIKNRELAKRPYTMNIIDELHANENAHTRILLQLLRYQSKGDYPILESFIRLANSLIDSADEKPLKERIAQPIIRYGQEYIDGLIEGSGQAVIIENKIHYAVDQNRQIESYFNAVRKHGIDKNSIYVIYLTRNGSKEVQDYSLTSKTKKALGVDQEHSGRFIKMNYRDHILPWLVEEVLPECCIKEELLISAIKQYIDHLEGLTGMRKNEKKINSEINSQIIEKLQLSGLSSREKYEGVVSRISDLQEVVDALDNIRKKMSEDVYQRILSQSKDILDEFNVFSESVWTKEAECFIQVSSKQFPGEVHFEFYPIYEKDLFDPHFELRFGFHMESRSRQLRSDAVTAVYNSLKNIPDILLYDTQNNNLKHGSAIFEKIYPVPGISLYDMSEYELKQFLISVLSEYQDFLRAFVEYWKNK